MRRTLSAAVLVAVAAVIASGCGGSSDSTSSTDTTAGSETTATGGASGTLSGSVGPGFDISMAESTVAAGTYTLTVDDQGTAHDFHFTGPGGVNVTTDVSGTGKKTFTVDLQAGTYTFVCDPHSSSMNGKLTVT
jgi:plastocyanin